MGVQIEVLLLGKYHMWLKRKDKSVLLTTTAAVARIAPVAFVALVALVVLQTIVLLALTLRVQVPNNHILTQTCTVITITQIPST